MIEKLLGCVFCILIFGACNRTSDHHTHTKESIRLAYRAWVDDMERRVLVRGDIMRPDGSVDRIGVGPDLYDESAMQLDSSRSLIKFDKDQLLTFLKSEIAAEKLEKTSPLLPGLICQIIEVDLYDAIQQSESIISATNEVGGVPLEFSKPFGPKWLSPTDVLSLMERLIQAQQSGARIVVELQHKRFGKSSNHE